VATRLAPTVRAPSMRRRSESLTGPRGSATGRRDPVHSGARHVPCGYSQAYRRRPFAPHDQLIQPPALLSLGRCSRSGVPDHVGRPGIVVQTPQREHNLSVATGEARRRGSSRNGTFARPALHGRTRRPGGRRRTSRVSRIRRTAENDRSVSSAIWRSESSAWYCSTTKVTAAAVRGWAGTSRCRGTPATAGAAGGAGRTRSHGGQVSPAVRRRLAGDVEPGAGDAAVGDRVVAGPGLARRGPDGWAGPGGGRSRTGPRR
jgi:hypothetical protein